MINALDEEPGLEPAMSWSPESLRMYKSGHSLLDLNLIQEPQ